MLGWPASYHVFCLGWEWAREGGQLFTLFWSKRWMYVKWTNAEGYEAAGWSDEVDAGWTPPERTDYSAAAAAWSLFRWVSDMQLMQDSRPECHNSISHSIFRSHMGFQRARVAGGCRVGDVVVCFIDTMINILQTDWGEMEQGEMVADAVWSSEQLSWVVLFISGIISRIQWLPPSVHPWTPVPTTTTHTHTYQ